MGNSRKLTHTQKWILILTAIVAAISAIVVSRIFSIIFQ